MTTEQGLKISLARIGPQRTYIFEASGYPKMTASWDLAVVQSSSHDHTAQPAQDRLKRRIPKLVSNIARGSAIRYRSHVPSAGPAPY